MSSTVFVIRSRSCTVFVIRSRSSTVFVTFLPNIKCQTPHMLKCLYSSKQNVTYYLTSLHINEWTLTFTLTWPKTSSVHFLFIKVSNFKNCPFFTTFMPKTHIQHHISEENKIKASSLTNAPLLHPGHLGVAHSQIWG